MEASTSTSTVQIGDSTLTIQRFSVFKAILAGEIVNRILKAVPDFSARVAAFQMDYREKNSVKLSRAAAELRYPPEQIAMISDEAWSQNNGFLELPASPGPMDIAAEVFPFVFEAARDEVLSLLALVAMPNDDLRMADESDDVPGAIDKMKRKLMFEDLGVLLDLAGAAGETLSEQFEGKVERVRKLGSMLGLPTGTSTKTTSEPTNSEPSTSTDSPPPTDGIDAPPSTAPDSERQPASSI